MGNIWATCCHSEDGDLSRTTAESPKAPLLTSALRVPSSLPSLQSRALGRREIRRVVRIESLSPMIEVDDEYDSGSEGSETGWNSPTFPTQSRLVPSAAVATTYSPSSLSPKPQSGLRLLLSNAPKQVAPSEADVEQKDDGSDRASPMRHDGVFRGMKRVERHDSLQTVLTHEESDVMYACAPVAAMREPELPKGLVYGFLDDSSVVRASFQNTLRTCLFGSDKSFIRGFTISEATAFPDEVIERKPDIVVLDNCLDYEVSPGVFQSIKGTELAREIRQKGFEGCIIMQSGDESLRHLVDFNIVDGITGRQKGTASFAIARMVAMARRKQKNHPNPNGGISTALSSAQSSWNSRAESSFSFEVEDGNLHKRSSEEEN